MLFTPIGTFFGNAVYKYEIPRQGNLFAGHVGRIELLPHNNFEMALRDLDGFERIWLIFQFNKNTNWRPTTRPPIPPKGKDRIGTFASRSPYRPNPIGLSCVRLLKIKGLTLFVDEADLLDATPILDIKPYIPMSDAFPNAHSGWVEEQVGCKWNIIASQIFLEQSNWIAQHSMFDLLSFANVQLSRGNFSNEIFDSTRRRIKIDENSHAGVLAFRTFRINFSYDETKKQVTLIKIFSGYSKSELQSDFDKYGDKLLHKEFIALFEKQL